MQGFIAGENYGVTRQALTKELIEGIVLPVPPLAEQRRIVECLERLMAHTSLILSDLNRIPKLISNCKTTLLDRAFSGALTQDWRKMHSDGALVSDQLLKVRKDRERDPRLSRRKTIQTVPRVPFQKDGSGYLPMK